MKILTREECLTFMMEHPRTAKIATVRADGRPHVAPIWFYLAGDALMFTTWHTTVKAANIERDPRVCLVVDDEQPPFGFVQYEGVASFIDDLAALLHWATLIGGRYMGEEKAEAFGKRNAVPGELLLRVKATKIMGRDKMSE
jgi:PPOX class probable F420-dependent enzyme